MEHRSGADETRFESAHLACPACGTAFGSPRTFHDLAGPVRERRCPSCGLAEFLRTRHQELNPVTSKSGFVRDLLEWFDSKDLRRLESLVPGRRLLDAGCGDGRFVRHAVRRGWQAVGVERDTGLVASAPAENRPLILLEDALESGDGDARYDAVVCRYVLEHVATPRELCRSIANRLAPGGVVMIRVPNGRGWVSRFFGDQWFQKRLPDHRIEFTGASVRRFLEAAGLTVLSEDTAFLPIDVLDLSLSFFPSFAAGPDAGVSALKTRVSVLAIAPFVVAFTRLAALLGRGGSLRVFARKTNAA